jgi:hypothetical protein
MGMIRSTWVMYGVRIGDSHGIDRDVIERQLRGLAVHYVTAGNYDRWYAFLVTGRKELQPGELFSIDPLSDPEGMVVHLGQDMFRRTENPNYDEWNEELTAALAVVGITPDADPAWIVVPDLS